MMRIEAFNEKTGKWETRNAFLTENSLVSIGQMQPEELERRCLEYMTRWQQNMPGKRLRLFKI